MPIDQVGVGSEGFYSFLYTNINMNQDTGALNLFDFTTVFVGI